MSEFSHEIGILRIKVHEAMLSYNVISFYTKILVYEAPAYVKGLLERVIRLNEWTNLSVE